MGEIDSDALTRDTQTTAPCDSDHMNLIWAIPVEFWKAAFASDPTMTPAQKTEIVAALEEYVIIGIVQADVGALGAFGFYPEEEVREGLSMTFTDVDGNERDIVPAAEIGVEAQALLAALKPILSAAMGNMGENLHFIVIDDDLDGTGRTWDPYAAGMLSIDLKTRDGEALNGRLEGPINALFVPRKCPNGKDAHVTWKFCPWTGKELK